MTNCSEIVYSSYFSVFVLIVIGSDDGPSFKLETPTKHELEFQVPVKLLSGDFFLLNVMPTTTVKELKYMIAEIDGKPTSNIKVFIQVTACLVTACCSAGNS
jgi:hypothetical protein